MRGKYTNTEIFFTSCSFNSFICLAVVPRQDRAEMGVGFTPPSMNLDAHLYKARLVGAWGNLG